MIEPCAAKHQLAQPIHQRLSVEQRHLVPAPDDIAAKSATRFLNAASACQLDKVRERFVFEFGASYKPESYGCAAHSLLEIKRVETKAVPEELDREIVARVVVGICDRVSH